MAGELPDSEGLVREIQSLRQRVRELELASLDVPRPLTETEARLKEQEDDFRVLMETFPEMVSRHRPNSTYVYVSPACTRLFGYLPEDLAGRKAYDFIHPEDVSIVMAAAQRALETGGVALCEYRHLTKDGAYVWVETTGRVLLDDRVDGSRDIICVVRDISERKQAQAEIAALPKFPGENTAPVMRIGQDGILLYANRSSTPLLTEWGWEKEQPVSPWWHEQIASVLESGASLTIEVQATRRIFSFILAPISDQGYVNLYGLDITERKRAEEALRALTSRQQALLTAIPDIVVEVDKNKVFTWTNPAGLDFYGEDALGKEAVFYFEGEQDTYGRVAPLFSGSEDVIYVESWQRRKDGEKRLLAWWCRVLKDGGGNAIGALSTARDITDIKQAEEAARTALTKYKTLFEVLPLGITVSDKTGKILEANQIAETLLGLSREEHTRRKIDGSEWRIVRPDGTPMPADEYASVRALKENCLVENVEMGIVKSTGNTTWISVTANPVPLEGYGVIIAYGDITERKRAEEALRVSEEKYRNLFETMAEGVFYQNAEGDVLFANLAAERILGVALEEILTRTSKDHCQNAICEDGSDFPDQDHPSMVALRTGRETLGVTMGVWNPRRSERMWIKVHAIPQIRPGETRPYGVFTTFDDITERMQAQSRLVELSARYQTLFEDSPIALWEEDFSEVKHRIENLRASGVGAFRTYLETHPEEVQACVSAIRVQNLNQAAVDLHKASSKQELLSTPHSLLVEETYPVFVEELIAIAEGRTAIDQVGPLQTLAGDTIRTLIRWAVPPGHETTLSRVFVAAVDVTERVLAERKLIEHQARLRSLAAELASTEEQERRRLAANLHDDIGQLLVLIKIKLGELKGLPLSDEAQALVEDARETAVRVIEKVRTITAELFPAVLYQFGLSAALEVLAEEIGHETGLPVAFHEDEAPKPLSLETSTLLYRSAREALFNVVKHARAHRAQVSVRRVGDDIEVLVEDDGTGFNFAEAQSWIEKANGLGLFIVEERLRYAGGQLTVDSAPGRGSRVTLRVPIEQSGAAGLGETR